MEQPIFTASILCAAMLATGCVPTSPTFDRHFGESARTLQAQQTANPNAPVANRDKPVDGIDGRAARAAYERYQRTFVDPPRTTNVFTIGIGTGGDTSGAR